MGFKSGHAGSQFIIRDTKLPILARYDIEIFAACEGALGRPWYHSSKFCRKKSW